MVDPRQAARAHTDLVLAEEELKQQFREGWAKRNGGSEDGWEVGWQYAESEMAAAVSNRAGEKSRERQNVHYTDLKNDSAIAEFVREFGVEAYVELINKHYDSLKRTEFLGGQGAA